MERAAVHALCVRLIDAWIARDADAILTCFTPDGTLRNPRMGVLDRPALRAHATRLFSAFPDLGFDIEGPIQIDGDRAAYRWVMHGTNTGRLGEQPPTRNRIRLEGCDFVHATPDGVATVVEYSDSAQFREQLADEG